MQSDEKARAVRKIEKIKVAFDVSLKKKKKYFFQIEVIRNISRYALD